MLNLTNSVTTDDIFKLYREGNKVVDITHYFLQKINELNPVIQALVHVNEEYAISMAKKLDEYLIEQGLEHCLTNKPLFGIPFILKDNFLVEGLDMRAASKILSGYKSVYSCDVFKFIEEAGGVLVGQSNMDEFALGSSTEYSGYDDVITKNPYDHNRVPGGSSGGSAAAIASGMAVFALGTDTGGSVRQPASFTGLFGFRPTYGTVSRYGVVSAASSFDIPGIFANTTNDTKLIYEIISKPTARDQQYTKKEITVKKLKTIGLPQEYFSQGLTQEVKERMDYIIEKLGEEYQLVQVSLPSTQFNIAAYYIMMTVELASNLERFDGVRYGNSLSNESLFYASRKHFLGTEVKRRIVLGTFTSSSGYVDAYYKKAALVREEIKIEFETAFEQVDVMLTPVSPFPAFLFGEKKNADPIQMYQADIMTLSPALAQNASISVPVGGVTVGSKVLPVGIQVIADRYNDEFLYEISNKIEQLMK
jgi:aspartyl-tRNA(Asn)/glutamyl-tRNA(Gln) amidotransferase subunit A